VHTRSVSPPATFFSPTKSAEYFPGGISAHGLSGFEPEGQSAFLTKEVTVNFTIPGTRCSKQIQLMKGSTPALQLRISNSRLQFHRKAKSFSDE
jgi:hypothetical protein